MKTVAAPRKRVQFDDRLGNKKGGIRWSGNLTHRRKSSISLEIKNSCSGKNRELLQLLTKPLKPCFRWSSTLPRLHHARNS